MNKVYKYTTAFSVEKQAIIKEVSPVILQLAPYTEENISYGMPAYRLKGLPLFTTLHTEIISISMPQLRAILSLYPSFLCTNKAKAPCNFHETNHYL
ncbi:DUF1801 domain-containing protein [Cellulophaga sp. F20128]|uniref:DUF1801 domain-containing protein n=1 Tax=Cellulophaga sp. F20128 TaxID=2926413 RepID=UPI001FF6A0A8|nr:DUF1801 domain-containing protein [Cellulophaga sp. F20128]MCK0155658.1 DUF1801 domain-containing protein [Cellulophaga sp. F20128]